MKRLNRGNRLLSQILVVVYYRAICYTGCNAALEIAVSPSLDKPCDLAGKATTMLGWTCVDPVAKRWCCPSCWARLMSARGITEEVDYALANKQRAAAIEVEERAA